MIGKAFLLALLALVPVAAHAGERWQLWKVDVETNRGAVFTGGTPGNGDYSMNQAQCQAVLFEEQKSFFTSLAETNLTLAKSGHPPVPLRVRFECRKAR
jgi:hypothetical protein